MLTAFACGLVALLMGAILTAFLIGWWAVMVVPVGVLAWLAYYRLSSGGEGQLTFISIVLVLAGACWAIGLWPGRSIWLPIYLFVAALWSGRFVYTGSEHLLRAFVLRNPKAFSWLREQITVRE